jgi:HK97 gp10 family phage protein
MSFEVSIGGLDELRARLAKLASADQMESMLTGAAQAGAMVIEGWAKVKCPVDTGFLRNSIQTESLGGGRARVFAGAEYAIYVEYGVPSRHMGAQPYMRPAADDHRDEVTQAAAFQLSKAIDEAMG